MRLPVPNNKLVAFTLAGALLTAGVAGALAMPGGGLAQVGEQTDSSGSTASNPSQQAAADTPTPNQEFTPDVQTQSGYEGEEDEGYEEHDEDEEEHGEDEEYDDGEEEHEEYDEDE